jgi:hypothetical protein
MTHLDFPRPRGAVPFAALLDDGWRQISPGMYERYVRGLTYFVAYNRDRQPAVWTVGVRDPARRVARFINTCATLYEAKQLAERAANERRGS